MLINDNHKRVLLDVIAVIIIILLCSVRLSNCKMPAIYSDEFGYWGNAATLVGYDWSELLYETPYYNLGYSLLLLPIIIFFPQKLWYWAAIILNIIFLILSFFICQKFIKKIIQSLSEEEVVLISLITVIYPSNIMQAQIAWSETFLYFLTWCAAFLLVKIINKFSNYYVFLFIFILGYMYFTHVRTISIVFAGIASLFLIFRKNEKSIRSFGIFIFVFVLMYLTISWIRTNQVEMIYVNSNISSINNASLNGKSILGYINRVLLSGKQLFISLYGKIFVLIVSTGALLPGAVWAISTRCKKYFHINKLSQHNSDGKEILVFFTAVSACVSLLLCVGQVLSWEARKDCIVYSRYFDNAIGPFLSIVLGYSLIETRKYKRITIGSLFFCGIIMLAIWEKVNIAAENFNTSCAPFIGGFYQKALQKGMEGDERAAYAFTLLFFSLSWMVVCFVIQTGLRRSIRIKMWSICFLVYFSLVGYYAGEFPDEMRKSRMEVYTIINEIEDSLTNCEIYYLKNEELDLFSMEPKWLQYNIPDVPIHVIDYEELNLLSQTNKEIILLTNKDENFNDKVGERNLHFNDKGIFGQMRLYFKK